MNESARPAALPRAGQIDPAPAHHAIALPSRARLDQGLQFGLLCSVQSAGWPRVLMIAQAIGSFGIEAVNPVPQCLAVHTTHAGRIRPAGPVTDPPPAPEAGARHSLAGCAPQVASGERPNSQPVASPPSSSARSSRLKKIRARAVRHFTHESVAASFGITANETAALRIRDSFAQNHGITRGSA